MPFDLTDASNISIIKSLLSSPFCVYAHFAPPCGTASRARLIQRKGRANPPVARTDRFPNGLPTLSEPLKSRVAIANKLYALTCDLILHCHDNHVLWSCENPGRSFMWDTTPFRALFSELQPMQTTFHHCRYGSARRKLTKLLHCVPTFTHLEMHCQNDHEHEPWGQLPTGQWATSEETAYPWDLCRSMAFQLAIYLQECGVECQTPSFAQQEETIQALRASTSLQPRRGLPPMVSEFSKVLQWPKDQPLPPLSRTLSTPFRGWIASTKSAEAFPKPDQSDKEYVTIGIHRSPEAFVEAAVKVGHPTELQTIFPKSIRQAVDASISVSQMDLAKQRTAELRRWALLAEECKPLEKSLKDGMTARRKTVLSEKRLVLFERLIEQAGHEDSNLVKDLANGFSLTGELPKSGVFKNNLRPAKISCENLRRVASLSRESILKSVEKSADPDLDVALMKATRKEVEKGFLVGPILPEDLPDDCLLTKRFPVKQKNKVRPIDDYKANMVNHSVTQSEGVSIHTLDHIAAMIAYWFKASRHVKGRRNLVAKCWDLSDAYKQIPLSDSAFDKDSFLVLYDPEANGPVIYQQKVLPFGSIASVTAFLRVSLAIWAVGNSLLKLTWSAYFDDFLSISEAESSAHSDMCIRAVFSFLGWKLSEDKLLDFNSLCKVLGVQLDLSQAGTGLALVANTKERVEELTGDIDKVLSDKCLPHKEGERLRGRLQFASTQLFGRTMRNKLKALNNHVSSRRVAIGSDTISALKLIRASLEANKARVVSAELSDHIHIYVDASFEPDGYCGIGGVCYDSAGNLLGFFSERAPDDLIQLLKSGDKETAIFELEAIAVVVAVKVWESKLSGHRVVLFTDNEGVRTSVLKGSSSNFNVSCLLEHIFLVEENLAFQLWVERVPSQSNPADEPSRAECSALNGNSTRVRVDVMDVWVNAAKSTGGDSAAKDRPQSQKEKESAAFFSESSCVPFSQVNKTYLMLA